MKRVFFGYCAVYCLYCLHKHHVLRNDLWLCWLISRQHLNIIFESSWNFGHLFNIVESYWLWYSSKRHCFYSWDSTFLLYLSSQSVLHNLPHPFIALFFSMNFSTKVLFYLAFKHIVPLMNALESNLQLVSCSRILGMQCVVW